MIRALLVNIKNQALDKLKPHGVRKTVNGIACTFPASIARGIPVSIDQPMLSKMLAENNSGKTIFDIGSHIGTWAEILSQSVTSNGKVICFEPNTINYQILKKQAKVNAWQNILPFNIAASSFIGKMSFLDLYDSKGGLGTSAKSRLVKDESTSSYVVDVITLDSFANTHGLFPDIIKIDVEGAELQVLLGMRNILMNRNILVFVELHQFAWQDFAVKAIDFFSFAREVGYKIYKNGELLLNEPDADFMNNLTCGFIRISR